MMDPAAQTEHPEDLGRDIAHASVLDSKGLVKVAICIPARGTIQAAFLNNFITIFTFLMRQPGVIPIPVFSDQMPVDTARNALAKACIEARADYSFWLDSDVFLTADEFSTLWRMVTVEKKAKIATGLYYEREAPYKPVIRRRTKHGNYIKYVAYPKDEPFTVDGMGMGCVLMDREVLSAAYAATNGKPFQFTDELSEDLFFCDIVSNQLRYTILCHPHVTCGHYGAFIREWNHAHHLYDEIQENAELFVFLTKEKGMKISRGDTLNRCNEAGPELHSSFQIRFPDPAKATDAELVDFYAKDQYSIFAATQAWTQLKRQASEVMARIGKGAKRFLDYGCGVGDYGLLVMENIDSSTVDFFDVNILECEYIRWRLKERKMESRARVMEDSSTFIDEAKANPYDVVFCFELLEHTRDPESHLSAIRAAMGKDGILFAKVSPKSKLLAHHISEIRIEDHGFVKVGDNTYVRDDSSIASKIRDISAKLNVNMKVDG